MKKMICFNAMLWLIGILLIVASTASAESFTFTTIDLPLPPDADCGFPPLCSRSPYYFGVTGSGINNSGQIVGTFDVGPVNPSYGMGDYGFVYTGGSFSGIRGFGYPGSTFVNGINNSGQIVGVSFSSEGDPIGWIYSGGNYSFIPGEFVIPFGINDHGDIVGNNSLSQDAFIYTDGNFINIHVPGAFSTSASGINNSGEVVGNYSDATGSHGFIYADGNFITIINVPGASYASACGINDSGEVVGSYFDATGSHGFVDNGGNFSTIDVPGASYMSACGINDSEEIVGGYSDATGWHLFVASPAPEPSTLLLLGSGLMSVILVCFRR